jgi:membrane-associated protease RseP (regulator of RpoE activity)
VPAGRGRDRTAVDENAPVSAVLLAALVSTQLFAAAMPGTAPPVVALSTIDGATTPADFVLDVDIAEATTARLVVDGDYVGIRERPPLHFPLMLAAGEHRLRVRAEVAGEEVRVEARFTVATEPDGQVTTTLPTTAPAARDGGDAESIVDTAEEIRTALSTARPGDVILVADGEYVFDERLEAAASGTGADPITLRGTRRAVIRTEDVTDDYGLHITGDHWHIEGITVAHASKGIVLDGSIGTVIDGVEVFDIGDEGVHFRSCSSDGVLRNSFVHDTGRDSPQYGEGVYVGSANSNWSDYQCADPVEGTADGDNTERVLIENNVFEDVTAEGADLKEGTDSGILRGNVFRRVGASGENSADSAVDAKGNNWVIEGNVVAESDAPWPDDGEMRPSEFADGFQSHSVYEGYGTGNVFRANVVEGAIPGFGVGLYPALGNIVTCDNAAPGAAGGLVGDNGEPADCAPA